MICVNAGDGSPEEAAQWIEYCNGGVDTPMGRLRAANAHPEPYHVKYWEVGNELWGRWQYDWTTADGYVDRYRRFVAAMRKADPQITLLACGAPVLWGKHWNDTLIAGDASEIQCVTDHPLIGGDVARTVDPLDVYRDFMSVPEVLEGKWAALRDEMASAGIQQPHLAITELQLFAHLAPRRDGDGPARLTPENLPSQPTITEAVYDILMYHAAVRLGPFVELITHSAIVNHGGGLRKQRERVWANPCYYAQKDFSAFANAAPLLVEITCAELKAPCVLPELSNDKAAAKYSAVDAIAGIGSGGDLLLSIVNRDTKPVHLTVTLDGWSGASAASVSTLAAAEPWDANTLEAPEAIVPKTSSLAVADGKMQIDLAPYSIVQVSDPANK
jgi:alpha-N-arabinofuranosidase